MRQMAGTMKRKLVTTVKGIDKKKYFVKFLIIAKTVTLDARTTEEKIERTLETINNIMSHMYDLWGKESREKSSPFSFFDILKNAPFLLHQQQNSLSIIPLNNHKYDLEYFHTITTL